LLLYDKQKNGHEILNLQYQEYMWVRFTAASNNKPGRL